MWNIHVQLYEIWISGLGGDVFLRLEKVSMGHGCPRLLFCSNCKKIIKTAKKL